MKYAVGIEIGGTKLQAGVGSQDGRLKAAARAVINPSDGAQGILNALPALVDEAMRGAGCGWDDVRAVGVGYGGPVDSKNGVVITSHQIKGWDNFPLREWIEQKCNKPCFVQNDASIAGYAEAKLGAGKGCRRVFYITIGSGIGGGWIVDGVIDEGQGFGAAEIGHTWVLEPETGEPQKLELVCSGWSIGRRMRDALEEGEDSMLLERFGDEIERITAKDVYEAAGQNDLLARTILDETCGALALAVCNVIALLHPERIVIGGGVSLMGGLFWDTLRQKVEQYVFKPFAGRYEIVPAALQEDVVTCGAVLLALEGADHTS